MHMELRVGGERGQAGGERGGEGAGRGRWRGQACTGTVAGWVGELLGVGLGDPGVTHASGGHVGRQVEALGPHGHAPLLLDLLGLLLPLSQVITQQLPLTLCQHLSIDGPLEVGGERCVRIEGHKKQNIYLCLYNTTNTKFTASH